MYPYYSEVVGQYEAWNPPLIAEYCLKERAASASPVSSDVVEGGHYGSRAALFHCKLERFQVDLTDCPARWTMCRACSDDWIPDHSVRNVSYMHKRRTRLLR